MGRILYIDDQELNRKLLVRQVGKYGHTVDEAVDGRTGLSLLNNNQYDLVLLDIDMPDLDGIDVLRLIRQRYSMLELPIIMLTANNQDESLITAMNSGANDYLVKPIKVNIAAARIKTQLALAQYAALKDDFLRFASHDLKKPLMFIQDIAEVLQQDFSETFNDKRFDSDIHSILDTCKNMQTVISGFLDQSKRDLLQDSSDTHVNINQLIKEAVGNNLHYANQKHHFLHCELQKNLPELVADQFSLRQVIDNLVGNAIKFSSIGSGTIISSKLEESCLIVSIQDQGPGLTDNDIENLFIKHAKLSNQPTGNEDSTGMGLALCKELVTLLGGEIGVQNNVDAGSTFWIKLPMDNRKKTCA